MTIFSPGVILAGIAPTLGRRTDKCRVISAARSADKLQAVAVNRLPVGLMYLERQVARPPFTRATMRSHSLSRTRAETWPTKTPGATSNSQRVRSPRKPVGHAVRTTTTMLSRPLSAGAIRRKRRPQPHPRVHPTIPRGSRPRRRPALQEPRVRSRRRRTKATVCREPCV